MSSMISSKKYFHDYDLKRLIDVNIKIKLILTTRKILSSNENK